MKKAGALKFGSRFAATLILIAVGIGTVSVGGAGAETFADSCGVLTEHELAKTFGQEDVVTNDIAVRSPGNSAGVLHLRCLILAWSGRRPGSPSKELEQVAAGEASKLRMETWIPDEGPNGDTWRHNFAAKVEGLTARARETFGEVLDGRSIRLPTFGVEHAIGFLANSGGLVKLRAIWWSASASSIVSVSATVAKGSPIVGSIKRVASAIVPVIH